MNEHVAGIDVRGILSRWGAQSILRGGGFGAALAVRETQGKVIHIVQLRTLFEERTIVESVEPYRGGEVPAGPIQIAVDPWAVITDAGAPATRMVSLPHTDEVTGCVPCAGRGRALCDACGGAGTLQCPRCGGQRYLTRQVTRQVLRSVPAHTTIETRSASWQSGRQQLLTVPVRRPPRATYETVLETVRQSCPCGTGRTPCATCEGRGTRTCRACAGSGKCLRSKAVRVELTAIEVRGVVNPTCLPDDRLATDAGTVILDVMGVALAPPPSSGDEAVDRQVATLRATVRVPSVNERIRSQQLTIRRLDAWEVTYGTPAARESRCLVIYGDPPQVHAPRAPWNRRRVAGALAGLAATVVLVWGLLFHLLAIGP